MSKSNWVQGIGIVVVIFTLGIFVLIPFANFYNNLGTTNCGIYEISFSCDMSNNSTVVFELFIAGIFAVVLSIYVYHRQEKLKGKRYTFAINRLRTQLYDLEPELRNVIGLFNRVNRLWAGSITAQQQHFNQIMDARKADLRRSLQSIQGTLRISFDVLDPMLSTRIDYFTRNGIEYCETDNEFNLLLEQFELLDQARFSILLALPDVERVETQVFNDFFNI